MSPDQDTTTVPAQSLTATLLWGALVAAFCAAAWLIWLSWAADQPDLTTWQIAGAVLTLLAGITVGVWRTGPVSAWALTTAPFATFGAHQMFGGDPLGPIGAAVWVGLVVMGVAALTALALAARLAFEKVRDNRNVVRSPGLGHRGAIYRSCLPGKCPSPAGRSTAAALSHRSTGTASCTGAAMNRTIGGCSGDQLDRGEC